MKKKIESYMGLARRSRNLVGGTDTCIAAMKKHNVKLLIIAGDAAENTREKLCGAATANNVNWRIYADRKTLSAYAGMSDKVVFAITDDNFAKVILKEIDCI